VITSLHADLAVRIGDLNAGPPSVRILAIASKLDQAAPLATLRAKRSLPTSASRIAYRATATALNSRGATEMMPFRFMNFKMPLTVSSRDGSAWPHAEASRAA